MDVSKRLTQLREKKGYTVNKLANMSGISQSFVRNIELAAQNPTVETLTLLCDALGISLRDFFDDTTVRSNVDPRLLREISDLSFTQQEKLTEFIRSLK